MEMQEKPTQKDVPMEKVPPGDGPTDVTNNRDYLCNKVTTFVTELRAEPIMAFYTLCTSVSQAFVQNVIIEKICLETGHTQETCNRHNNETLEAEVQGSAAQYLMSLYLLRLIPAMFISVVIGHWSDLHGRKQILVFALCGNIITYVLYTVNAVIVDATPIYMVLAAIPAGLCGDYTIMMFGMYSIIRDTTSLADLAVKIAVIDGVEQIANEIGPLIGAQLYSKLGYVSVFVASIILLVCGVLYTVFRIKEPQFEVTGWKRSMLDFLNVKSFFKNLTVLTQKRDGHRRAYISANMFCAMLFFMCYIGYEEIIYLYGRLVVGWDVMMYSYFTVLTGGLQAIGFLIILPLAVKFFNTSDIVLVLIGITTGGAWFLSTAFVRNIGEMFGVRCIGIAISFVTVSFRSITLKCVLETEVGKITAMYSIAQTLGQILGRVISTQIYVGTLKTFPGTYFAFCSGICGVITVIFGALYWDVKRRKDVDI